MLRRGGELGWVVGYSLGGESWDGEEEAEIQEELVYIGFYRWNYRWTCPVSKSAGDCATSLYGDPV